MLRIRKWLAAKLYPAQAQVIVTYSHRLTPELFKQAKAKLPGIVVQDATSEIRAGYLLGIQHALDVLATDFTISAS